MTAVTSAAATFDILRKVTTATITTMLLKRGIRRCWMNGPKPLVPGGPRLIGPFQTCKLNGIDPRAWLADVYHRLS